MISLQVPDSMISELQRISATSGVSRSELVREACTISSSITIQLIMSHPARDFDGDKI